MGTPSKQLESCESRIIDSKHDVDRILLQHSYAHPYNAHSDIPNLSKEASDGDKGDIFYATYEEANDCITVEVPCDDQPMETEMKPIMVETDFNLLTNNSKDITLECDMKLLSPLSLSPQSIDENLLALSPAHTALSSDLGYESLCSPLSDHDAMMDLPDLWSESLSDLFPGLV